MKLIHDDVFFHPDWGITGLVRQLIWETGNSEKPYLAAAVSYAVKGYTEDGELVNEDNPRAVHYDWLWYRVVDFYDELNDAWKVVPAPKDVVPVRSGDGYASSAEAGRAASEFMEAVTPDSFRPDEYANVLELGLHKLLP